MMKRTNWTNAFVIGLFVCVVALISVQHSRQRGISGFLRDLFHGQTSYEGYTSKNLITNNQFIDEAFLSEGYDAVTKVFSFYLKWTPNVEAITFDADEKKDIVTLEHGTVDKFKFTVYMQNSATTPDKMLLGVRVSKDGKEVPSPLLIIKEEDTFASKIPTPTNGLNDKYEIELAVSRNYLGHYRFEVQHGRKNDKSIHRLEFGASVISGVTTLVECDAITCTQPPSKKELANLVFSGATLDDTVSFTFDMAYFWWNKNLAGKLFNKAGNGEYVWTTLYDDTNGCKVDSTTSDNVGYYPPVHRCIRAFDPNEIDTKSYKNPKLNQKTPNLVSEANALGILVDEKDEEQKCVVESNAKPSGFNLSGYKKLPCTINETKTNPCGVCDYKKFHDAAIGPSTSGVSPSTLKDIANSTTTPLCSKCITEHIDEKAKSGTVITNDHELMSKEGNGIMRTCASKYIGTDYDTLKDTCGSSRPNRFRGTTADVKNAKADYAEAQKEVNAAQQKKDEVDAAVADGTGTTAEQTTANNALEKATKKLSEKRLALAQAKSASSSSTVPTPASTTSSSTGANFIDAFGKLMGGASSTSSWLPAWASTDDNKSKTIQVVDDNYNVFVDTGRGGGGRRGYGYGRYATGGVWDDLYGMSAASTSSYDCQNLNTQRKFDTMNRRCQNMWLNIYGKELEDCYKYVKRGHAWSTIPRRCKNLLSSYFSLSRDGYDNTRLSQLAMKDYETNEVTNYTYCNTFCKNNPCTKQCKRWNCSNCVGVDSVDASEITEAVNAAKDIWKDKKANHYSSMQRLWYMGDNGRTGRSYHHFPDNLKGVDDNDLDINTYQSAVPISELRAW